jgi:hypothetical protein
MFAFAILVLPTLSNVCCLESRSQACRATQQEEAATLSDIYCPNPSNMKRDPNMLQPLRVANLIKPDS